MKYAAAVAAVALSCAIATSAASAREWHVNVVHGDDAAQGTEAAPLKTAQRAVDAAAAGDVIHLGPPEAVIRQSILFRGKTDVTLDGHGATLDGSDPLPTSGRQTVRDGLRRLRLPRTWSDRHLLTFDGRTEHMGRTQSNTSKPFLRPDELQDGQFTFVNELPDDVGTESTFGWLYVRGEAKSWEWSTRLNGVGFGGENRGIVVKNLNARRFLNDGFNIHGQAVDITFDHVTGYECFDEGLSAHEACTCRIVDSRFWGCENAVADVNDSETDYLRCEFGRSLGVDALLVGKRHSLVDCRIENAPGSTALSAGSRGVADKPFELLLERVTITSTEPGQTPRVRISDGLITLRECNFADVDFNATGATVRAE